MTKSTVFFLLILTFGAIGILTGIFLLAEFLGIPVSYLTKDPLVVAEGKSYYGLLSNIGIVFWSTTLGICLLTAWILRMGSNPKFYFFLFSALFTAILLFDDLFMLHERFNEVYLFSIYSLAIIIYILKFRKHIFVSEGTYFLISLCFFSISIIFDSFQEENLKYHYLFEDGFKFLGITFWMGYFLLASTYILIEKKH